MTRGSGGRSVCLWVTPWVAESTIMDTRAIPDVVFASRVAGRDVLPEDTVLLLVHPARMPALRDEFKSSVPIPVSDDYIADVLIDNACLLDEDLARKLDWKVVR